MSIDWTGLTRTTGAWLLLAASAAPAAATEPRDDDGLELEVRASFDAEAGEIPESVATDAAGNLYASVGSQIRRAAPDGDFEVFGTLPLPVFALGVKVGADGCAYTVSTSLSPDVDGAFVWRICEPDAVEAVAALDPAGGPNDLAFGRAGELFVTDPVLGRIWRVDSEGNASVWAEDPLLSGDPDNPALLFRPLGVNGIALDATKRHVYVSNTDLGQISRLRVDAEAPAAVEVFAEDPRLLGADGIAFDRRGRLLVTVNFADALLSVDRRGRIAELASGGLLDSPSSVAFGATRRDRDTLYVASSAFGRIFGLREGEPRPALLEARFPPGRPGAAVTRRRARPPLR